MGSASALHPDRFADRHGRYLAANFDVASGVFPDNECSVAEQRARAHAAQAASLLRHPAVKPAAVLGDAQGDTVNVEDPPEQRNRASLHSPTLARGSIARRSISAQTGLRGGALKIGIGLSGSGWLPAGAHSQQARRAT